MIEYKIEYVDLGISQTKFLIPHEEYLKYKIYPNTPKKDEQYLNAMFKKYLNGKEWFTDRSPLFLLTNKIENKNIIDGYYESKYVKLKVKLTKLY